MLVPHSRNNWFRTAWKAEGAQALAERHRVIDVYVHGSQALPAHFCTLALAMLRRKRRSHLGLLPPGCPLPDGHDWLSNP